MFKSVGLVARFDKKPAIKLAEDLANYLREKGLEVFVEDTLANKASIKGKTIPLEKMKTDFIITVGGDGTILRTCVAIPKPEPPILTINMGIRGFLTEVEPKQAFAAIDKCLKKEFEIEKCMKLSIMADGTKFPDALNEVLIVADEPVKLLYTRILKDGQPILGSQADGLMVSTQTGSTGYSLSAGGPVLDPNVDAFVLTSICALSVFRSIVFPANSNLTIEVVRPRKILVIIDGQHRQIINSKLPRVTVTRSKYETSFIRFRENFYHRLRSRLLFKGV
ncbi:MAG: NAD(+)/NADH kinase [Candidatus Bathyarchaeota archaeon]|nr:NAD(+) kinase [Candidatus Bathyarchaeota archaeon A05DMB-5]MDH7557275.1 NAD(+)/NADH kinase [Candidatus Bathyarchaeota archaeon]